MPEQTPAQARQHLIQKYPNLGPDQDDARLVSAIGSSDYRLEWRDIAVRWFDDFKTPRPPASREDVLAALCLLRSVREQLDVDERRLIDMARREKATWPQIAAELGHSSAQAAQQRRKRLENAPDHMATMLDPDRTTEK